MISASLVSLVLLVPHANPPRKAVEKPVVQETNQQAAYYKTKWKRAKALASRFERQRNHLRRALKIRYASVTYAIKLASTAYGVSEWQMHRVASCESGHSAFATNGQYRGVFQEGPMFERGPFGRAGFSVFDPIANSMTAAYTVARGGWSQWSCKP